jgi:hypothetical protein
MERVGGGLEAASRRLRVALRELHTDNGGEFINQTLYDLDRLISSAASPAVNLPSTTPVRIIARFCSFPFIVMSFIRTESQNS